MDSNEDKEIFLELNPEDIYFTKDVIRENFSDGTSLDSSISIIFNNTKKLEKA